MIRPPAVVPLPPILSQPLQIDFEAFPSNDVFVEYDALILITIDDCVDDLGIHHALGWNRGKVCAVGLNVSCKLQRRIAAQIHDARPEFVKDVVTIR